MSRTRRGQHGLGPDEERFGKKGEFFHECCRRMGWPSSLANVMVEGTIDVEYCRLADSLYRATHSKTLLDDKLSVFAVGKRDEGGTRNIRDKLQWLKKCIQMDHVDGDGNHFRAICLLDDDYAGRRLRHALKQAGFIPNRDVFLLSRKMPRCTRDPIQFQKYLAEQNKEYVGLDCEIEDLLSRDLLDAFAADSPGSVKSQPQIRSTGYHYEWDPFAKPQLLRFAQKYAVIDDVKGLIETLHSVRYMLGLRPEGESV